MVYCTSNKSSVRFKMAGDGGMACRTVLKHSQENIYIFFYIDEQAAVVE
jgi:hypothetical protein